MKVAVCISGHLRSFSEGYDYFFKNIIEANPGFKFDFFVSTWDVRDWRTEDRNKHTKNIFEDFNNIYNPVTMDIEDNIVWDTSKYMPHVHNVRWLKKGYGGIRSNGGHILGMYYKIKKSNDLKVSYELKNNFKYDLVIRHRTDFAIEKSINLERILDNAKETIYIPNCDEKARNSGIPIRDVFAVSSSENMDYYSSLFDNIDFIVKKYDMFRPEPMLYNYLSENKDIKTLELINKWKIC